MADPQGIVYFNGMEALLQGSFTLAHGIAPSLCTITIPPQKGKIFEGGKLTISYNGKKIEFPDCKIDEVNFTREGDGFETWTMNILDRRWKWQFGGQISGSYNTLRGGAIIPSTKKHVRDLARLCLTAMGEKNSDASKLPNDVFPEVDWDYELPAEALAKLCDGIGYRVVLKASNNQVQICKLNEGAKLPESIPYLQNSISPNPPERPDELVLVGARTLYQIDVALEPVGLDVDGQVKPLLALSYAGIIPDIEQFDQGMCESITDPKIRELAKRSLFRWYRIFGPLTIPGTGAVIRDMERLLPLTQQQVETEQGADGQPRPKEPVVYGLWYSGEAGERNTFAGPGFPSKDLTVNPEAIYERGWTLDTELGIVKLADPLYRFVDTGKFKPQGEGLPKIPIYKHPPATLILRVAAGVRDADTRAFDRYEVVRKSKEKKFGTEPEYIRHDDLRVTYFIDHARGGRLTTNTKDFTNAANKRLDEYEKKFTTDAAQAATYVGFHNIDLDGAIQQITWSVNASGATTRVSRNQEELIVAPSNDEKRLAQKLKDIAKAAGGPRAARERLLGGGA